MQASSAERRRQRYETIVHGGMYGVKSWINGIQDASAVSMLACLIQLHPDEVLTEGQVSRATRLDRVAIRTLADLFAEADDAAPPQEEGGA